jgi:hypothetical protein
LVALLIIILLVLFLNIYMNVTKEDSTLDFNYLNTSTLIESEKEVGNFEEFFFLFLIFLFLFS